MKFLFYIIILPFSKLPLSVLYGISDFLAFILKRVVKYRRDVIIQNLTNSFPEKTASEIKAIADQFYKHLSDILLEGIKNLSLKPERVMELYKCKNPEVLEPYYDKKQSVILVSSHYNNWEYMVLSLDMHFRHHGVGVGKPLSDKWFDHVLNRYRQRYGTEVVFASNVRETFEKYEEKQIPSAYMMLFDQSPNNPSKSFWTEFLHQDTGFIFGPEYFAKKYNFPVFYYQVDKVKRGHYEFTVELVTESPQETSYGEITTACISRLETAINTKPAYWLWSHKRWKHKR